VQFFLAKFAKPIKRQITCLHTKFEEIHKEKNYKFYQIFTVTLRDLKDV